jgi:uncharacterized protein (DUF427 family)
MAEPITELTSNLVRLESNHRRLRVLVDGVVVADTVRSVYLFETDHRRSRTTSRSSTNTSTSSSTGSCKAVPPPNGPEPPQGQNVVTWR